MLQEIMRKTLRVPTLSGSLGDGEPSTRQLDSALMGVGFKLSSDLFMYFSHKEPSFVVEQGTLILAAVKELVGDHVKHNPYFINFPHGVPDTREFWLREVFRYMLTGQTKYGRYQHSYEEMLALQDEFLSASKDRVTVLHLGKSLQAEADMLYMELACRATPLNESDRGLMKALAEMCLKSPQPDFIPVRETKAIINVARLLHGLPFSVDTVTDILRLACALSDGDVTLQSATKFRSFSNPTRRRVLHELNDILLHAPAQLADVHAYSERWKRLGERLHPHEYAERYPHAAALFAVARGERKVPTLEAKIEKAFQEEDIAQALRLLAVKPGMLVRSVDHIIRSADAETPAMLTNTLQRILPQVSGRVLLGLREHLQNRLTPQLERIFTNSKGHAWVTPEALPVLASASVEPLLNLLDETIVRRLPRVRHMVVDRDILDIALPLSEKNKGEGFGVLPRGSIMQVGNGLLRFFVYWKQTKQRTDYDLSALLLDENFRTISYLSYTRLASVGGVHSGDLTEAPDGATEFIDIDLSLVDAAFIVPTINIYHGESFQDVESCFFGMMQRDLAQQGKPFEPETVRFKSDIRGDGRIAFPLVFRKEQQEWSAKWMHLFLQGMPRANRVESSHVSVGALTQSLNSRSYLDMNYLIELLRKKTETFSWYEQGMVLSEPVTFIGMERPDGLPAGSTIYTLRDLSLILPA